MPSARDQKLSLSEYQSVRSLSVSTEVGQPYSPTSKKLDSASSSGNHSHAEGTRKSGLHNTNTSNSSDIPKTSTPKAEVPLVRRNIDIDNLTGAVGFSPVRSRGSTNSSYISTVSDDRPVRHKKVSFLDPLNVRVPLVGFEVMEQRAKFTVSGNFHVNIVDKIHCKQKYSCSYCIQIHCKWKYSCYM